MKKINQFEKTNRIRETQVRIVMSTKTEQEKIFVPC